MKLESTEFKVQCEINDELQEVTVIPLETTDGAPHYKCMVGKREITQIRKETMGKWEQLWGNLDQKTVLALGSLIESKLKDL